MNATIRKDLEPFIDPAIIISGAGNADNPLGLNPTLAGASKIRHWFGAFAFASAMHAALFAGLLMPHGSSQQSGAVAEGKDGIEVGLGMHGAYQEQTPMEAVVHEEPLDDPQYESVESEPQPYESEPDAAPPEPEKSAAEPSIEQAENGVTGVDTAGEKAIEQNPAPAPTAGAAAIRGSGSANSRRAGGKVGDARSYFAHLLAHLQKFKTYPRQLKKNKQQGVVQLKFSIDRDGYVVASSIEASSGSSELDLAALKMLRQADPLPAVPDSIKRDPLTLVIPIEYSLITNSAFKE